jgi:hypothetical protein
VGEIFSIGKHYLIPTISNNSLLKEEITQHYCSWFVRKWLLGGAWSLWGIGFLFSQHFLCPFVFGNLGVAVSLMTKFTT